MPMITTAQQEESLVEEQIMEQLLENEEMDIDVSEFSEWLQYYRRHPIDLNTATASELQNLVFLTPLQINNLIAHRATSGALLSVLELQAIDGFDLSTIALMQPFVHVREGTNRELSLGTVFRESEYEMMARYGRVLERQRGYHVEDEDRSRYLGSPDRITNRIRVRHSDQVRLSINMDKDAGEPFFKGQQRYGFDFYSASLSLRRLGRFEQIVIGDYALQFGQGLVAWNGLNFGKGAWVGAIAKQGVGLRQYTSLNENNFMRGVSATHVYRRWKTTPFLAWNKLSGNVQEEDGQSIIQTINYSGYHRTATEQSYRRAVDQYVAGVHTAYQHRRLLVGMTYMATLLSGTLQPQELLRNRWDMRGDRLQNVGVHYQYTLQNLFLFGETAMSGNRGWATSNGVIASLHPQLSAVVHYRNYQKDYHHFFAQSIGEQSRLGNENGVYAGLIYQLTRKIEWMNYLDVFRFPGFRYRVDAPSHGVDFLSQFSYLWYKKGRLLFRTRHRLRQENYNDPSLAQAILSEVWRGQYRLDFQFKLDKQWSVRSRVELASYFKEFDADELGCLAFQDVAWSTATNRFRCSMRLAYFRTDSYNSRLYAYEQDVLYGAGFPMYYGTGVRMYANTYCRINRMLDIWLRYAMTSRSDTDQIGSGLDLIEGSRRSDVRIQLRFRLR